MNKKKKKNPIPIPYLRPSLPLSLPPYLSAHLGHVQVQPRVVPVSREIVALDEALYAFLDEGRLHQEARRQLLGHLGHQLQRVCVCVCVCESEGIREKREI